MVRSPGPGVPLSLTLSPRGRGARATPPGTATRPSEQPTPPGTATRQSAVNPAGAATARQAQSTPQGRARQVGAGHPLGRPGPVAAGRPAVTSPRLRGEVGASARRERGGRGSSTRRALPGQRHLRRQTDIHSGSARVINWKVDGVLGGRRGRGGGGARAGGRRRRGRGRGRCERGGDAGSGRGGSGRGGSGRGGGGRGGRGWKAPLGADRGAGARVPAALARAGVLLPGRGALALSGARVPARVAGRRAVAALQPARGAGASAGGQPALRAVLSWLVASGLALGGPRAVDGPVPSPGLGRGRHVAAGPSLRARRGGRRWWRRSAGRCPGR